MRFLRRQRIDTRGTRIFIQHGREGDGFIRNRGSCDVDGIDIGARQQGINALNCRSSWTIDQEALRVLDPAA